MQNMAFFMTTTAIKNRTKTHTVRDGWKKLTAGTLISAVVKAMHLRPGQHVERLATIRVTTVARRPLNSITQEEVIREGFPDWTPQQFVAWYTVKTKCQPSYVLTFIGFEYA